MQMHRSISQKRISPVRILYEEVSVMAEKNGTFFITISEWNLISEAKVYQALASCESGIVV
jgi:hypothetical protein